MSSWKTALRIARREARRAKGRSILVLMLITLPVMMLAFAAVSSDMFDLTAEEEIERQIGKSQAMVTWQIDGPVRQPWDGKNWTTDDQDTRFDPAKQNATALLKLLPADAKVTSVHHGETRVQTPNGYGTVATSALDVANPITEGIVSLVEGTAPASDDQVTLNPRAAQWLDVKVGDTIRTIDPDRTYTVTGLVETPEFQERIFFRPGALPWPQEWELLTMTWLVDSATPLDWAAVQQLNMSGITAVSRAVYLNPPADDGFPYGGESEVQAEQLAMGGLIAGIAVLEIILLAGPAFAVGARRRSRDLALIAANGGTPAQLRRIVLADGVVLGVAGAIIGIALGVLAAVLGRPLVEEYVSGARAGGWRFYPTALLAIAALAVITGVLAAMVPAFIAARQDVVTVLAGRRGTVRSRKRWIMLGLIMVVAGVLIGGGGALVPDSTIIMVGVVVAELGLVLVTPALVGLVARLGRRLPLSPRIALRDTARNRSSAAPAISAIMAAVAGAVAIGVFVGSNYQRDADNYRAALPMGHVGLEFYSAKDRMTDADWLDIEQTLTATLPVKELHRYQIPTCEGKEITADAVCQLFPVIPPEQVCPYTGHGAIQTAESARLMSTDPRCSWDFGGLATHVVDDGSMLPVISVATPAQLAEAKQVLADGGVVVRNAKYIKDGKVTFAKLDGNTPPEVYQALHSGWEMPLDNQETFAVPAIAIDSIIGVEVIMSPPVLAGTAIQAQTVGFVASTDRPPTSAEEERLQAEVAKYPWDPPRLIIERGPSYGDQTIALILALAAAAIALGAAGVATGLAMADGRADLGTLAAVGASPGVRRRLSLSQSGVISVLGAVLGTLAGLGAAAAIISALNRALDDPGQRLPFVTPWATLAIVLAVPLIAMAGAGLLTRSRLPIERRF